MEVVSIKQETLNNNQQNELWITHGKDANVATYVTLELPGSIADNLGTIETMMNPDPSAEPAQITLSMGDGSYTGYTEDIHGLRGRI